MMLSRILRRTGALALVVALLVGMLSMFGALAEGSYYCTANRVNMRTGPSSSYASITKLKKGDVVTYISSKNGWYKVSYFNKRTDAVVTGYVYRRYLSPVTSGRRSSSARQGTVATLGTTYKTRVNLRVRSKPSITEGYVKTKLRAGTKVAVLRQKRSWVYITYRGGSGWVSAKYLKKVRK